jgi:chemotaxis protein MotA
MDIATLLGLVVTFALIVGSIVLGGNPIGFVNLPSVFIVLLGTAMVGLVYFPLDRIVAAFTVAAQTFRTPTGSKDEQRKQVVELALIARREGLLAVEGKLDSVALPLVRKGLQLVADGVDPDTIELMMDAEVDAMVRRHADGAMIFQSLGTAAPAMGLIGTLIGLVQMLQSLDDPSSIGPAMAVALLTTFYGAILANVILLPLAGKLRYRHSEERLHIRAMIDGVISIARGVNPRVIEQQIEAPVSPRYRAKEAAG